MVEIGLFPREDREKREELAALLAACFPHCYAGDASKQEADGLLEEGRVAVLAQEDGALLGFAGAIPQYGVTGWELHPLMVCPRRRHQGLGRRLVTRLEAELAARGGVTLYLGTDDEFGQTSLSGVDLYTDLFGKIRAIRNLREHPYEFYQKAGFQIVGVLPDANGIGKPDIWMAKRIESAGAGG